MRAVSLLALCGFPTWAWRIALRAADRRGISVGTFPRFWAGSTIVAALSANVFGHADERCAVALEAIAVAAVLDLRSGCIFDPVIAAGLSCTLGFGLFEGRGFDSIIGVIVGSGLLMAVRLATRGRGLGLGDVKLAAVLGAGLGPSEAVVALGLAFVIGGAVAALLLATGKAAPGTALPFGPYLLAGILSVLSYHQINTGVIPWP
jgi:leader peptidase (prepilin peptidase)/N-methyltransferase